MYRSAVKNLYKLSLKTRGFPNKFSLALKNAKIRHFKQFLAKVLIIKYLPRFLAKIAVLEAQKSPVKLQRRGCVKIGAASFFLYGVKHKAKP